MRLAIYKMNVLIACEESATIREAFAKRGHYAMSCDLKPTKIPGPHHEGDVREVLHHDWDLLIAHPVCRYLTNSSNKHLYKRVNGVWAKENGKDPERWRLMRAGAAFYNLFRDATHIPKRCIENPIMHGHAQKLVGGRATQYVQPWMFGDPFSKSTGLRLDGLPPPGPREPEDGLHRLRDSDHPRGVQHGSRPRAGREAQQDLPRHRQGNGGTVGLESCERGLIT